MEKSIFEVISGEDTRKVAGGLKSVVKTKLDMTKFCFENGNVVGDYTYQVAD